MMQNQPGTIIRDRYQIMKLLGSGSTGNTYAAKDRQTNQQVALKELSLVGMIDWKILELFEREAQVLSSLNHLAIPQYLDYFQVETPQNHYFYLVQALAPGISLANLVQTKGKLAENVVQEIAIQVLDILDYLHHLTPPIIHRDLKPHNLIYNEEGKIYLVDFGSVQNVYRNTLTQGSTVVGTYGYMAPEQFRGQAYPSSDLYSLGATLLFLLIGKSPGDLPQRRLKIDFRPLIDISPGLANWLEKLLEPAPEDRFNSVTEAIFAFNHQQSHLKPAHSEIKLQKKLEKLIIDIPFLSWQLMIILAVLGLALVLLICLLPILFVLIPLAVYWLKDKIIAQIHLEINQQHFLLIWRWLGLSYACKGKIEELDRVELNSKYSVNGTQVSACALIAGVHTYRFAESITLAEKQWLLNEINNFLDTIKVDS